MSDDTAAEEIQRQADVGPVGVAGIAPYEIVMQPESLIHYVMDLEALIRWFALLYTYEDPNTGEKVTNDPIWTTHDEYGNYLAESDRLKRTWHRVMGTGTVERPPRPEPEVMYRRIEHEDGRVTFESVEEEVAPIDQ